MWDKIVKSVDDFALIEISDNGTGIPEENFSHLFESFFTTKERGKGTGLGLSISTDIIKKHNGNIAVESTPNEGTTFQIFIPIAGNEEELNKLVVEDKELFI